MTRESLSNNKIVHVGIDESGSLPDKAEYFVLAGVLTHQPDSLRNLIRRVAVRSGKRLHRPRRAISEFKWSNSSSNFRKDVLNSIAQTDISIYTLLAKKDGRQINDTSENYAALISELLQAILIEHSQLSLAIDRHFTSPAHIAIFNTLVYRHLPTAHALSIYHVDSQRNSLVQLADFVAGCVYAFHKEENHLMKIIEGKIKVANIESWIDIKRRWITT